MQTILKNWCVCCPLLFVLLLHLFNASKAMTLSDWNNESNGAEDLIFEEYFHRLVENWQSKRLLNGMSESQASMLQDDLKGLYKTLKNHPALMDRRLRVGGKTPPSAPPVQEIKQKTGKRSSFNMGVAQPACPFKTEWMLLVQAKDMNDSAVEIFQPQDNSNRYQWFYTVSCDFDVLLEESFVCPYCCRGINHHRYSSQCIPRRSYVMALVRRPTELTFDWDYIQVDTSCNCAINPST